MFTTKDSGGNKRLGSIEEVYVYIPCVRILKPIDVAQSLSDYLPKSIVERL